MDTKKTLKIILVRFPLLRTYRFYKLKYKVIPSTIGVTLIAQIKRNTSITIPRIFVDVEQIRV